MQLNRRNFLGALGSGLVGAPLILPPAGQSGIKHIVVVTMENRSFDHLLGWLPGSDGKQAGLFYPDKNGVPHATHALAPDYTGCGHPDPDHSYGPGRVAWDRGRMDGFLRAGSNDVYSIGYYGKSDLPFFSALAENFTVCDHYFASILSPTIPNRMFLWSAQTDRLDEGISLSSLPTIFDRLAAAGVSHRYYFNNLPYLALWGFKYFFDSGFFPEFLTSAAAGTLPAVSFVDPAFTVLDDGTGNDDHPHADIRNGDAFLSTIYRALSSGPAWKNTVLIVNFDEWGGFFDHVPPPRVVAPNNVDTDRENGKVLLGFRVPTVIASPFTRNLTGQPRVNHTVFDHTSVLKLIEWRFGLAPLTTRDASGQIGNLAEVLDFSAPAPIAPALPNPGTVIAPPCLGAAGSSISTVAPVTPKASAWRTLSESDATKAWLEQRRAPNGIR